jgi:hypothetical protein
MPSDKTRRSLCARRCQDQGEIAPARTRRRLIKNLREAAGARDSNTTYFVTGPGGKEAIRSLTRAAVKVSTRGDRPRVDTADPKEVKALLGELGRAGHWHVPKSGTNVRSLAGPTIWARNCF